MNTKTIRLRYGHTLYITDGDEEIQLEIADGPRGTYLRTYLAPDEIGALVSALTHKDEGGTDASAR